MRLVKNYTAADSVRNPEVQFGRIAKDFTLFKWSIIMEKFSIFICCDKHYNLYCPNRIFVYVTIV